MNDDGTFTDGFLRTMELFAGFGCGLFIGERRWGFALAAAIIGMGIQTAMWLRDKKGGSPWTP